jgi:hypothetical protein
MPKLKEQDYLLMCLRLTSHSQLYEWLDNNPPPKWWPHGKYAWAFSEGVVAERMPLGKHAK